MTEKGERKADRTYILTERQFIESVLVGATTKRFLPPGIAAEAQRAQVETAENGGVVVRVWVGQGERTVPLEPQVLLPLLKDFASQLPGDVPTITEVRLWSEADLLEVSNWVRALHTRRNPIAGIVLPEVPDQPLVLFEVRAARVAAQAFPAKPAKKAKVAKKASKKARPQKGSLGDAQALEARASKRRREDEDADAEPDVRDRPGQGP